MDVLYTSGRQPVTRIWLRAVVYAFLVPRLPPGTIVLPKRPDINRAALVLAGILLFLARAAQLQKQNTLVDAFVVTVLFASSATVIAFIRRKLLTWSARWERSNRLTRFSTALLDNKNPEAVKWLCFYLALWNFSLILVLLNVVLDLFSASLVNLLQGAGGAKTAAVIFSMAAYGLLSLKTRLYDRAKLIGGAGDFLKSFVLGVSINSVVLYYLVFWPEKG